MVLYWKGTDFKGAHVKSERSKIFKYYFEFDSPLHNFTKTSLNICLTIQYMKKFAKSKMSKLTFYHRMGTIRKFKELLKTWLMDNRGWVGKVAV